MKTLDRFRKFAITQIEISAIKGGKAEYAYCTNGAAGSCFQYFDDATNSCLHSLGCTSVTVVQV